MKKIIHLVIRVPEDFHRIVKSTAYKEGSSIQEWVKEILKKALEERKEK